MGAVQEPGLCTVSAEIPTSLSTPIYLSYVKCFKLNKIMMHKTQDCVKAVIVNKKSIYTPQKKI